MMVILKKTDMVIPPPVRPPKTTAFLKPCAPKMHFTNKLVSAQAILTPPATIASSASSVEKALRSSLETTRDVSGLQLQRLDWLFEISQRC
jgi:hypothetical protein